MSFNTEAALLDAIVLAVIGRRKRAPTGYRIPGCARRTGHIESTLYPALTPPAKDGCLTVHDEPFNGLQPPYYQITPTGPSPAGGYRAEWDAYTAKIDRLFEGRHNEQTNLFSQAGAAARPLPEQERQDAGKLQRRIL